MDSSKDLEYKIKKSTRARRMSISIYPDRKIVVTVPMNFDHYFLNKFLNDKKDWIFKKVKKFLKNPKESIRPRSKKDFQVNKDKTLELLEERVKFFNQFYNFKYNKIRIKNQKTRWGSCSKKGNLNFNYRIIFLREDVRDYIVVHELCHLGEFNHSKNFWNLVKIKIPNYLELKNGLK